MEQATRELLENYYEALNSQDMARLLALLDDEIVHDVSQGERRVGRNAFADFIRQKSFRYREHIFDIEIMTNENGSRAATEYAVLGIYLDSEQGMPLADGQTYRLPGGSFFEIKNAKIARVSNHYNLRNWMAQISLQGTGTGP